MLAVGKRLSLLPTKTRSIPIAPNVTMTCTKQVHFLTRPSTLMYSRSLDVMAHYLWFLKRGLDELARKKWVWWVSSTNRTVSILVNTTQILKAFQLNAELMPYQQTWPFHLMLLAHDRVLCWFKSVKLELEWSSNYTEPEQRVNL